LKELDGGAKEMELYVERELKDKKNVIDVFLSLYLYS
jgi:hypothetical protein